MLGKVFIVLDYPAVFRDAALESENTIVLDVEESVYNLAVEHGRVLLTTVRRRLAHWFAPTADDPLSPSALQSALSPSLGRPDARGPSPLPSRPDDPPQR